jgi:hypothetical protein
LARNFWRLHEPGEMVGAANGQVAIAANASRISDIALPWVLE